MHRCWARLDVFEVCGGVKGAVASARTKAKLSGQTLRVKPELVITGLVRDQQTTAPVSARRSRSDLAWRPGHNPTRVLSFQ